MIPLILAAVGGAILGNALRSDVKKFSSGGEILLAPNGKPSNLNSEQWHLVRTPEFKAWFGDFENDPENSSKVVDKNGEPLVVYHGSSYGSITNFNRNESSRLSSGLKEYGSYFATNKKLAEFYHTHGKLKKETIDDIDFQIYRLDKAIDNVKSNRDYDDITNEIERLEKIKKGKVYPVFLKLMKI